MLRLPILGDSSLIYGAADAGGECRVRNVVPSWSALIYQASFEDLNLKPHMVIDGRSLRGETKMASCVDLEGHRGTDGRMYLLDFSRTFPCAFRPPKDCLEYDKLWPFFHMFRQEFVCNWKEPLSSDSYSNFQSTWTRTREAEARANQASIREATQALMTDTVDEVASALSAGATERLSMTHVFHRAGLNMRYLGLVYERVLKDYDKSKNTLYASIQAEALTRVFKSHIRSRLRMLKGSKESALAAEAASILNSLFGRPTAYGRWTGRNGFVETTLRENFHFSVRQARRCVDVFLSGEQMDEISSTGHKFSSDISIVVLSRLDAAVGLGLRVALDDLRRGKSSEGAVGRTFLRPFEESDVFFEERVKVLDVVERARGMSNYLRGGEENLLLAFQTVQGALEASPNDPWLTLLMADICNKLNLLICGEAEVRSEDSVDGLRAMADQIAVAELFAERSESYYRRATDLSKNSSFVALRSFGLFLLRLRRMQEAEELLLQCLERCMKNKRLMDPRALIALVNILEDRGDLSLAASLSEQLKTQRKHSEAWENTNVPKRLPLPPTPDQSRRNLAGSQGGSNSSSTPNSPALGLAQSSKVRIRQVAKKLDSVIDSVLRKSPRQTSFLRKSPSEASRMSKMYHAPAGTQRISQVAEANNQIEVGSPDDDVDSTQVQEFLQAIQRTAALSLIANQAGSSDEDDIDDNDMARPDFAAPVRPDSAVIARNRALLERLRK